MKKNLLIFILLLSICSSSFARIMFQGSYFTNSFQAMISEKNFYDDSELKVELSDYNVPGILVGTLWEFDTDSDSFVHYYMGGEFGLVFDGVAFAFDNGLNIHLFDFGKNCAELNLDVAIGHAYFLYVDKSYVSANTGIVFMNNTRRGLYGEIGLITQFAFSINPSTSATDALLVDASIGLSFVLGVKI